MSEPMHGEGWITLQGGCAGRALPLVCDSPHSGTRYPDDFGHAIERAALRLAEDTHVEALWAGAPAHGATLLQAHFPRSYIDANRVLADLDPAMLDGPWPGPAAPSERTRTLGMGLCWRQTPTRAPIYDRRLGVDEVQQRIARCWQPYHDALRRALDAAQARFGACWHLNLHSMPSNAYERLGLPATRPLADVVLGDLHGRSCAPDFRDAVRALFEAQGLSVAVNDPYEGQALVQLHGQPAHGRHSLQIELKRSLYMDEATRTPNAGFGPLKAAIDAVLAGLAEWIGQRPGTPASADALAANPGARRDERAGRAAAGPAALTGAGANRPCRPDA